MSLETGTWLSDLVAANPLSGDKKKQGDDHLRLIKAVLQATFPNASKAFYFPSSAAKSADFAILATDLNKTFVVDTTAAAATATLPTLGSGDAGWECSFIKSNTGTNPYFIAPPGGTIQSGEAAGLTKTRRCIPGHRTKVLWTGTVWIAERVPRTPIGTILDIPLTGLAVGFEWANGQTLSSSANYPDYNAVAGGLVVPDRRDRAAFGRGNMGGADAGLLTVAGSGIDGLTLGATWGTEKVTIQRSDLPNDTPTIAIPSGQGSHKHPSTVPASFGAQAGGTTTNAGVLGDSTTVTLPAMSGSFKLNDQAGVGVTQTNLRNIPPAIITNFMVVVE